MEDLIATLSELIEVIKNNSVPLLITVIGTLVPIFISILVFIQSYRQNKKNIDMQKQMDEMERKLQKEICDREIKAQMHGDILKIYDDFTLAQNTITSVENKVHVIFSNFIYYNGNNTPLQWVNNISLSINLISKATNRANLLLPASDKELRKILKKILDKYNELKDKVDRYYYSGEAFSTVNSAWQRIVSSSNIQIYNYDVLMNRPTDYEDFLNICDNKQTKEINKIITEILPLFDYEKFDQYFEPYLQMKLIDDNT